MRSNQAQGVSELTLARQETGYRHSLYAAAFEEFGAPLHLVRSDGWLLRRPIPGSDRADAMGCYPLFCCGDWDGLAADLATFQDELVSVSLVSDPFAGVDQTRLEEAFSLVVPFKRHFVSDLSLPRERAVSKHHYQCARKALQQVEVTVEAAPKSFLDTWTALYGFLSERHGITGIRRFSRRAFRIQLEVPGTVILAARHRGEVVGATWWLKQGDVIYEHLAAFNESGYRLMASYALVWSALEYFRGRAAWLHLGAGAGLDGAARDGLTFFKNGWATETRTAYFCGRILDAQAYKALAGQRTAEASYFPAYRAGEFG